MSAKKAGSRLTGVHQLQKHRERYLMYALFLLPAIVFFILAYVLPFEQAIKLSFFEWNGISSTMKFAGLDNFKAIFHDKAYFDSFMFTIKFVLVSTVLVNVIGFALAYIMCGNLKTRNLLRSVFFLPQVIGTLILGYIWQFIFSYAFPQIGEWTGIELFTVKWLSRADLAYAALVMVFTWYFSGYLMVIYIAALQGVPDDVLESAQLDGASGFVRLKSIILPVVAPSITANVFLALVTTFKMFDLNVALTKGGPFGSTESIGLHIYNEAFNNRHYGAGSAKGLVFFILIAALTLTQTYIMKKREVDMG